jgi:polar amino acid transport system ATP-binding protein
VIALETVTKRYGPRTVLDAVTLRLERGVTVLCGPSGGGKSTLLRCIVGLERFDSGRVRVGDIELPARSKPSAERAARDAAARIRLAVGMVLQHGGLFAHMTALANVMEAPVHVRGIDPRDARERANALLERVGLSQRRDALPRELSGGEKQRVALARALAMAPEALLLDEPTSALDPERKADIVRLLEGIASEGTTMAIVTHEPRVLGGLAQRALVLRDGRIVADGMPAQVLVDVARA